MFSGIHIMFDWLQSKKETDKELGYFTHKKKPATKPKRKPASRSTPLKGTRSDPGHEETFWFTLPLAASPGEVKA